MTPKTMAAISPGGIWSFGTAFAFPPRPLPVASARAVLEFVGGACGC